jgi:polysaccharide biosynthesis transport protein
LGWFSPKPASAFSIFDIDGSQGLTELLGSGEYGFAGMRLDPFIKNAGPHNISVLPSGAGHHVRLQSSRIGELIDRLRGEYDVVIIDTPPVLQLADARRIGRNCDGVALVIRAGVTSRAAAIAAAEKFDLDRTPILGTILNDWNPKSDNSESSRTYSRLYRHYYGKGRGEGDL